MEKLELASLHDEKLFELCQNYGRQALQWRQKFIGLLPEVNRRKLYVKKGFHSIFEFAAKLAGLSEEQTRTAINLDRVFEDKPVLKSILVNGEASINKLVRVTSVVTEENEEFWAEKVKTLSKSALETLVRDEKRHELPGQPAKPQKVEVRNSDELQLASDIKARLLELQHKGIDINEFLKKALDQREEEIKQEKQTLSQELRQTSRHIPAKIQEVVAKEHGTKCSIRTCKKPSRVIHHAQRFALSHLHDPNYLAPLCREHHEIAHSIDLKYQDKRTTKLTIFPGT